MDTNSKNDGILKIKSLEKEHLELGKKIICVDNGALYPFDILTLATLNRSLSLCSGFRKMIYAKNFICAAPLIRLQLDSVLRMYAASIVNDPHSLSNNIFQGISVRDQKDKTGKKMTDAYLVEGLSKDYEWIESVYKQTSGYIHLSINHIANACKNYNKETRSIEYVVSNNQDFLPQSAFVEAINAFIKCTETLFVYLEGWVFSKNNPTLAKEMIKQRELKTTV